MLSIADFAKAAGVSKVTIYKRLEADLAPYAGELNGKKAISKSALSLFNQQPQEEKPQEDYTTSLLERLAAAENLIEEQKATIQKQESLITAQAALIADLNQRLKYICFLVRKIK